MKFTNVAKVTRNLPATAKGRFSKNYKDCKNNKFSHRQRRNVFLLNLLSRFASKFLLMLLRLNRSVVFCFVCLLAVKVQAIHNERFFCFAELTKVGVRVEELLESLSKILEEDKKREKELQVYYNNYYYSILDNYRQRNNL